MKRLFKILLILVSFSTFAQDQIHCAQKSSSNYSKWSEFDSQYYVDGPNCFNTSLRVLKIQNVVRYVDTSEFDNLVNRKCNLVKAKDLLLSSKQPLLAIVKESTGIMYNPLRTIHSFSYFSESRTSISKLNWKSENPTYIKSLDDELEEWDIPESCIIYNKIKQSKIGKLINKDDLHGCKRYIQYYKCSQQQDPLREDIKILEKKQLKLESSIEQCIMEKKGCDLKRLSTEESTLSQEITNLRIQIEKEGLYSTNPNYKAIRDLEISEVSYNYQLKLLKGEPII